MFFGRYRVIAAFAIAACFCSSSSSENTEYSVRRACQRLYPVSDAVIDGMLANQYIPKDRNATCWYGCALEKMKFVKNGKIRWNVIKNVMNMKWPEYPELIDKIVEICEKKVREEDYDNSCDLAYSFASCKKNVGDELGLPPLKEWIQRRSTRD